MNEVHPLNMRAELSMIATALTPISRERCSLASNMAVGGVREAFADGQRKRPSRGEEKRLLDGCD